LTDQSWNTKISVGREKHRHLFPILQESSPSTPNRIQITSNHYWASKGVPHPPFLNQGKLTKT
jgi:hypothetical protein